MNYFFTTHPFNTITENIIVAFIDKKARKLPNLVVILIFNILRLYLDIQNKIDYLSHSKK